jgi:hypothetical protein
VAAGVELRVYLPIPELGRQFAAYLGSPLRARGYPPSEGDHALIVEVAPGLAIERIIDLALKSVPDIEPGIHFVERQFGVLEVHSRDPDMVERAGAAILEGIGARPEDTLRPHVSYMDVIEVTPALFAAVAANAAERVAPETTLVTVSMIGAAGRVYLAGTTADIVRARDEITRVLEGVRGRT